MTLSLFDMHVHLDFIRDPEKIAAEAAASGLGLLAMTVTPRGYQQILPKLNFASNVKTGVGLHPWWAADGRCGPEDAALAAELIWQTRYVGEIGLDASPKHVPEGSLQIQMEYFKTICAACAETSNPSEPKVLSLHSVQSGTQTLDILEQTGCLQNCRCIFHWFTGSNEELNRAIKAGCLFSVNEMMLRTRRGREYARQLPPKCLLIETDFPPGQDVPFSASEITASMERTLCELKIIRGMDMREIICSNSGKIIN